MHHMQPTQSDMLSLYFSLPINLLYSFPSFSLPNESINDFLTDLNRLTLRSTCSITRTTQGLSALRQTLFLMLGMLGWGARLSVTTPATLLEHRTLRCMW